MITQSSYLDLNDFLIGTDRDIRLNIPADTLPDFLVSAYQHSGPGRDAEVLALLTPSALRNVTMLERQKDPCLTLVYLLLGLSYQRIGRLKSAAMWYERLVDLQEHPLIYGELAQLYHQLMLYGRARRAYEKQMALIPDPSDLVAGHVDYLLMTGETDQALSRIKQLVETGNANPHTQSSFLFMQQYDPDVGMQEIVESRRQWGQRQTVKRSPNQTPQRDWDSERPLRVGFLSADFRRHSVAYNFEALLDFYNGKTLQIFGYGNVAQPDEVTQRLREKFDGYRDIVGADDREVAEWIERDRIDILVALAGHSAGNRLTAMARRPAPIQVDSGALATIGLPQIDYRVSDSWLDPESHQKYYAEKLIYLPGGYLCYRPPVELPPVGPSPALAQGYITFGSFNNLPKLCPPTVKLWASVLKAVPNARLVLKFPGCHDTNLAARVRKRFGERGIEGDRLLIPDYCRSYEDHMRCYHGVDIALDTFPFNGCVTSLEALMMGVPLITRVGERLVSRVGLQVLSQIGLTTCVAHSDEEYVAKAVALAGQGESLATLRSVLRARLLQSSLCDGPRFARAWEKVCRQMWQQYIESRNKSQETRI